MSVLAKDILFTGGRVYLEDKETGEYVEVGLVQTLEVATSSTTDEVMDYSEGLKQVFDEILTSLTYTVNFTTKQVNVSTLSKAFLASVETGVDNPLVDGVRGGYEKVTRMTLGRAQQYQGKFKFESEVVRGEQITVLFDRISLKSDTNLALIGDKAAEIKFSGKAGKGVNGGVGEILRGEAS